MNMNTIENKVLAARALRTAFNATQRELLKGTWMDDEMVLNMVREMQQQHKLFDAMVAEIKEEDACVYDVKILGMRD